MIMYVTILFTLLKVFLASNLIHLPNTFKLVCICFNYTGYVGDDNVLIIVVAGTKESYTVEMLAFCYANVLRHHVAPFYMFCTYEIDQLKLPVMTMRLSMTANLLCMN